MCAARAIAVVYTKSCLVDDLVYREATVGFPVLMPKRYCKPG